MLLKQALEQFEIFTVYIYVLEMLNIYIYLSNLHLYLLFIFIISYIIYININNNTLFKYNIIILFMEVCYKFLLNILINQAGKEALPFFSYIYTLFFFICVSNIIGIMPFSYTITSHIIITFSLGFTVLIAITILGFSYQNLKFLDLFVPKNIPI
jgi:F-type H+-transporting ATPase subunit a